MKNVIILGAGRTGSSFLAGLIARDTFYINKELIQSRQSYPDGDYENPELIELNKQILIESGHKYSKAEPYESVDIKSISALIHSSKNITVYQNFIKKCNQNIPWLWKDPRLCYTIFFWKELIDLKNINFIFITRNPNLVFRSHSKHRIKYSKNEVLKKYYEQTKAVEKFLSDHNIKALNVDYSELKHVDIIKKLNNYLLTDIQNKNFDSIYKPVKKKKESEIFFLMRYYWGLTKLILLKNKNR